MLVRCVIVGREYAYKFIAMRRKSEAERNAAPAVSASDEPQPAADSGAEEAGDSKDGKQYVVYDDDGYWLPARLARSNAQAEDSDEEDSEAQEKPQAQEAKSGVENPEPSSASAAVASPVEVTRANPAPLLTELKVVELSNPKLQPSSDSKPAKPSAKKKAEAENKPPVSPAEARAQRVKAFRTALARDMTLHVPPIPYHASSDLLPLASILPVLNTSLEFLVLVSFFVCRRAARCSALQCAAHLS
jgi:hypothetical protein